MDYSTPGFSVLQCLPEFAQTHVCWVSDAIQPSHPLSPPSPPALNLAPHQDLFQWAGSSHQVAKVLELQHQSFQWILGLVSFRIVWIDLLAVQGTLKSLLQHQSLKASILWCSVFFTVQLSHPYMTTEVILHKKWSPAQGLMAICVHSYTRVFLGWLVWLDQVGGETPHCRQGVFVPRPRLWQRVSVGLSSTQGAKLHNLLKPSASITPTISL